MNRPLNRHVLHKQTLAFAGTCGESHRAGEVRFVPAFLDPATGRVEIARLPDGAPAPMHLISNLPAEWAAARDADGEICALLPGIVAGFVRDNRFYTREEAAGAV